MEETGRADFEKGLKILWIIWAAMLGSLLIYVFICHQVGEEIRGNMTPELPIGLLKNTLYGAVIVTLLFAHFLRRFMLTGRFSRSEVRPSNPGSMSHQRALLAKYTVAVLVSLALCEGIGIYGVVLFFLGAELKILYIFIAISALSMFFYRPKMEELERLAMIVARDE